MGGKPSKQKKFEGIVSDRFQSKQTIAALKLQFQKWDLNGDGKISQDEIAKVLADEGIGEEETALALQRFTDYAKKKKGTMTFESFRKYHYRAEVKAAMNHYIKLYQEYDQDGDNKINKSELLYYLSDRVGTEECNYNFPDWWKQIDPDDNGFVLVEDFALFFYNWDLKEEKAACEEAADIERKQSSSVSSQEGTRAVVSLLETLVAPEPEKEPEPPATPEAAPDDVEAVSQPAPRSRSRTPPKKRGILGGFLSRSPPPSAGSDVIAAPSPSSSSSGSARTLPGRPNSTSS